MQDGVMNDSLATFTETHPTSKRMTNADREIMHEAHLQVYKSKSGIRNIDSH
jgi:hypothetical protein